MSDSVSGMQIYYTATTEMGAAANHYAAAVEEVAFRVP